MLWADALAIPLKRPTASVEWTESGPQLIGADLSTTLVEASAHAPHRFVASDAINQPSRGAKAYGLLLSDGRIADPLQVLSSNIFDYGDFTAQFGSDVGSRRMFDHGKGVCDIARARIAWARARCMTLPAIGAKGRVLLHFEDPLVIDLCGRAWSLAEQGSKDSPTDPHAALWHIAVARGLATVPAEASPHEAALFARAFVQHARSLDPDWPIASTVPADGAMDDALNEAFSEAIVQLHAAGALLEVENDFDFGAPPDDWESAAKEALRAIRRPALVRQLAPTEGGRLLAKRSYADVSIAELAEDLAAWTRNYALPRGQLSPETAAGALQLRNTTGNLVQHLDVEPESVSLTELIDNDLAATRSGDDEILSSRPAPSPKEPTKNLRRRQQEAKEQQLQFGKPKKRRPITAKKGGYV